MRIKRSRRAVLSLVPTLGIAGCLDTSNEYQQSIADLPHSVEASPQPMDLSLIHWFPPETFDSITARISERISHVSFETEAYQTRKAQENAVANGFVRAAPPDIVHTVLGQELARYVHVSELHQLADLDENTLDSNALFTELCRVDGGLFAVPVSITPMNALLIDETAFHDHADVTDEVASVADFLAVIKEVGFGLRNTGTSVFQLFAQVLLGQSGETAFGAISSGELSMQTLRHAIETTASVIGQVKWLPSRPSPSDLNDCPVVLYDGYISEALADHDRSIVPFPETRDVFVLHATGCCVPKRGTRPRIVRSLMHDFLEPHIQHEISVQSRRLPATSDTTPRQLMSIAEMYTSAELSITAVSTGCGMDPDTRLRTIKTFQHANWAAPESIGDELGDILR